MEMVLKVNTVSVIVAHNHPMGQALPSPSDNRVTRMLASALLPMNIDFVDHIIVGENNSFYSFHKAGELGKIKQDFFDENNLTVSAPNNEYE